MTSRMLLIFPCWLITNTFLNIILRVYQSEGKTTLVNIIALTENLLIALIAALLSGFIGADSAWFAYPAGDVICILIIAIIVMIRSRRFTFNLPDWMLLDPSFGVPDQDYLEMQPGSMEDVIHISERVVDFCMARSGDKRKSILAGLAVEEMAGNVITHGFSDGRKHFLDIRLTVKDQMITIRLRDDCISFDPKKRMEQYRPEDSVKNIGIRMITGLTNEIFYQGNAGINTLLIKIYAERTECT